MGFFTRSKTADPQQAQAPAPQDGKKIALNFGGRGSKAVQEMAAATLEAGGYIEPPPPEPEIGDKMLDGTIFAGLSPDTGKAMYATPSDAPLSYTFNQAQKYAAELDAHGHQDWRVPTKDELNVLFNNRTAIGGFNATASNTSGWHYWSSSQYDVWGARSQRFSDGYRRYYDKGYHLSLRCVR